MKTLVDPLCGEQRDEVVGFDAVQQLLKRSTRRLVVDVVGVERCIDRRRIDKDRASCSTLVSLAEMAESIVMESPSPNWARPERYVRFCGCPVRPLDIVGRFRTTPIKVPAGCPMKYLA